MKHRYPIAHIRWVDSAGNAHHGWESIKEDRHVITVDSVGYLVDNNADFSTIVSSVSESQVHAPLSIPSQAILSKKILLRP